jgi:hypothetical protein
VPSFPASVHLRGGRNAAPVNRAPADERYEPILLAAANLRRQGLSLRAIAREVERTGVPTRHGFGRWHARQVARILALAGAFGDGRSPTEAKVV